MPDATRDAAEVLAEIEGLLAQATQGPWLEGEYVPSQRFLALARHCAVVRQDGLLLASTGPAHDSQSMADAALIAAAPHLLAECVRLLRAPSAPSDDATRDALRARATELLAAVGRERAWVATDCSDDFDDGSWALCPVVIRSHEGEFSYEIGGAHHRGEAAFIAASPTLVPDLLAAEQAAHERATRAEAERDEARALLRHVAEHVGRDSYHEASCSSGLGAQWQCDCDAGRALAVIAAYAAAQPPARGADATLVVPAGGADA